jgi:hypothetical protein
MGTFAEHDPSPSPPSAKHAKEAVPPCFLEVRILKELQAHFS